MIPTSRKPLIAGTLLALAGLLAWDAAGGDLALARWAGTPYGFPWRHDWLLAQALHPLGVAASWCFFLLWVVSLRWPVGPLARLPRSARVQVVVGVLLSVLLVSLLKRASATSCPWDLQAFGGVAQYVSHWRWGTSDGGPGGCFPAGHASSALAWLAAFFVLRRHAPRWAWPWFGAVVLAGLLLGGLQQLRGAHFMSHTLWTAWLCWSVGLGLDACLNPWRRRTAMPLEVQHG